MNLNDVNKELRRSAEAAGLAIPEGDPSTEDYLTPHNIIDWANALKAERGLTQQQVADEINALRGGETQVDQSHVSKALRGHTGYLKMLLPWLEHHWPSDPISFERDETGEPVWRIKLTYDR